MPLVNMNSFTTQQRILVVQTYYENGRFVKNTFRNLRTSFGQHGRPSESGIWHTITCFEKTG